jgi:protein-tyrosine phosphatase
MRHEKWVESFALFIFIGIGSGCAARQSGEPSPHQYAVAEKMTVPGIKDFGKVDEYLYRGAQPKPEGIEELKKLGIDTIVDLRGERHGLMERERAHAESLRMRLISIPGTGWTAPRDEQMAQFFALVSERPRRKIFIHCWFGGDRDGMFVAAYRIAFNGWTPEEAIHEMKAFHYKEFLHPNMKWYVRKFPERLAESPALAAYRQIPKNGEQGSVSPAN